MIRRSPMGSTCQPLNHGSGSTKDTAFIQCVDSQVPHIHEFWILGLDGVILEVHTTVQVEAPDGTIVEFAIN